MANSQRKGTRHGWCFGGLNIRRFIVNGENKRAAVERLIDEHKLDILVIGESWLTGTLDEQREQHEQLRIDGFSYVRFDRTNRAGGGLIIYIRRIIQFSVTSFDEWTEENLNLQYVELAIDRPIRFDFVAIYSPPNYPSQKEVQRLMDVFLKRSKDSMNSVMLIGDMNIARERQDPVPILRHLGFHYADGRTVATLFRQFEKCYYAEALITGPTCSTGSCIDHIITNIHKISVRRRITGRGVDDTPIDQGLTDHALIWCRVGTKPPLQPQQQSYYLLRLSDGKSEQTQIDNKGGKVGQSKNLSHNAQVIIGLIEDGKSSSFKENSVQEIAMILYQLENYFRCKFCHKVFKSKCFPDHMERKHGKYMCRDVHCTGLRFKDSQERGDHENDGNHLVCKECKLENRRAFSSKAAYKKHQKSHRQQPKIMKGFMVK